MAPPGTFQLDYVFGGTVTYPPGATYGPRQLTDFELIWIVQGDVIYHLDGRDLAAPAGTIVLARPGFRDGFTWDVVNPTRHAFFHFMVRSMPNDWPAPDDWPVITSLEAGDIVRPLCRYIIAHTASGRSPRGEPVKATISRAVETTLSALLLGPIQQTQEDLADYAVPVRKALSHARAVIEKDPAQPLRLVDLATAASVSPAYLCRLFARAFGISPMEAVQSLRLDMAVQLLSRSNLTVKEVAYRTGFSSPYHFSRRFSRAFGFPPSDLRARIAAGLTPPTTQLLQHVSTGAFPPAPGGR